MKKRKELKEEEKALFLIDMNNGFCENGNLADSSIKQIVPNIIPIIRETIEEGEAFFVVNDRHTKDSIELKRYPAHCMGDEESRTIKELAIYEQYATKTFYKNSTDAMFAPGVIDTFLEMNNLKQVIITGCCTDICIQNFALSLRNFLDEMNIDADVIVPKDAVETYHIPSVHDREENNKRGYRMERTIPEVASEFSQ
mgnify:CR=1 FL=1